MSTIIDTSCTQYSPHPNVYRVPWTKILHFGRMTDAQKHSMLCVIIDGRGNDIEHITAGVTCSVVCRNSSREAVWCHQVDELSLATFVASSTRMSVPHYASVHLASTACDVATAASREGLRWDDHDARCAPHARYGQRGRDAHVGCHLLGFEKVATSTPNVWQWRVLAEQQGFCPFGRLSSRTRGRQ